MSAYNSTLGGRKAQHMAVFFLSLFSSLSKLYWSPGFYISVRRFFFSLLFTLTLQRQRVVIYKRKREQKKKGSREGGCTDATEREIRQLIERATIYIQCYDFLSNFFFYAILLLGST